MISILVLTKNEEQDLPGCLESVAWSDDIHVYDSYSEDRTVQIAEDAGATVIQRQFDNWSAHQNWGLRNIRFKHPWVFYIDADERMTPELAEQCRDVAARQTTHSAFDVRRRDFWNERHLKHVQASPYFIRLFRPEQVTYHRLVNPVTEVDGTVGRLSGYLDHYPFSKGIGHWLRRHDSYSTFEAQQIEENRIQEESFSLKAILTGSFQERRKHQKLLFYRLPFRPLLKFLVLYVLRLGFLDGKAGLRYAALQAFYEQMIVIKSEELAASRSRDQVP